jgi:hypothetical protein
MVNRAEEYLALLVDAVHAAVATHHVQHGIAHLRHAEVRVRSTNRLDSTIGRLSDLACKTSR